VGLGQAGYSQYKAVSFKKNNKEALRDKFPSGQAQSDMV
jgi:hypothetical protein